MDGEITELQLELLRQLRDGGNEMAGLDHALLTNLFENFGLDRGILVAMLMNKFELAPGQAVFVAAGVPHSYLSGLGVEILNSSDNVVRGGLTPKKVSAAEFVSLLDFASAGVSPQTPREVVAGLSRYEFPTDDFSLSRISVSGSNMLVDFKLPAESILVCTSGELDVTNSLEERVRLRRGEAAYMSADANFFTIAGSGEGLLGSGPA
jgi:mannose-6-phosphate isomerase